MPFVVLVLFLTVFVVVKNSIERMDMDISSYYEFGNILPKSGSFSILLYLAILIGVILFFVIVLKVELHSLPA